MPQVCLRCGHAVTVYQNFCGNCGARLNAQGLDEPTERRNESKPQHSLSHIFPEVSSETYSAGSGNKKSSSASLRPSSPHATSWPSLLPSASPRVAVYAPVTSPPNATPAPYQLSPAAYAISEEKTQILASDQQSKVSRRRVLRTLAGLGVLAAAGIGAGEVISSHTKAGAARIPKAAPRLQPGLNALLTYTYTGHRSPVNGVIWEPITSTGINMFRIASCANDVQIWNGLNGSNVTKYNTYQGEVFSISWCHSTNKVVSGNADGTAHIWLAASGQYVNRLAGHTGAIHDASWAKDGVHIATASDDMRVGLWLLDTQHNDASSSIFFQNHKKRVYAVHFSDDSRYLVSGSADGTAIIWHVDDHTYQATYTGHHGEVRTVAFAPGSSPPSSLLAASGSDDQSVQVWTWNPQTKAFHLVTRYTGHHASINTLVWSPDGSRIASGDGEGQVHIWQSRTGEQLLAYQAHQAEVSALAWSPEGQYLASAGWDHLVHVMRVSCAALTCRSM